MHSGKGAAARIVLLVIAALAAVLAWPGAALAHPAVSAVVIVKVRDGGAVTITVYHDALAYALNDTPMRISDAQMYALLDAPDDELAATLQDGRERFEGAFDLFADGKPLAFNLARAPNVDDIHTWLAENPSRTLPCRLDFVIEATLPPGASTMRLKLPGVMGECVLNLDRIGVEPVYLPLAPGEASPNLDISMATHPVDADGTPPDAPGSAPPAPTRPAADNVGALSVAWRFIQSGFVHIIPGGPDHCLFVLGLFLLSPKLKPVLWQISAFTLAHTLTLTLTSLHIIGVPLSIVEPTIAASIVFVGVENLIATRIQPWRPVVAFIFGLVHGMGVATSYSEVGVPSGQLVTSLASFTVGVEAGHLVCLGAAFALLGWSRKKPWYRGRVAIPLSLAIAAVAMFWLVQRLPLSV